MVADIAAAPITLHGLAISALVMITNVAAGAVAIFCITALTQIMIIDIAATAAALPGIAISALVVISNVATGAIAIFRIAALTQIMIINVAATATTLPCIAIGTLVMVINIAATGKSVTAEHQQHRKNQFHLTLPWVCRETARHWMIRSKWASRHAIKLTSF